MRIDFSMVLSRALVAAAIAVILMALWAVHWMVLAAVSIAVAVALIRLIGLVTPGCGGSTPEVAR
ncbi:MAG: hypothetical protein ACK5RL_13905 [Acidimicrobiales bacterium]